MYEEQDIEEGEYDDEDDDGDTEDETLPKQSGGKRKAGKGHQQRIEKRLRQTSSTPPPQPGAQAPTPTPALAPTSSPIAETQRDEE